MLGFGLGWEALSLSCDVPSDCFLLTEAFDSDLVFGAMDQWDFDC